ncbi:hypothetical protein [Microbacterium sp. 22296]|uniref:hypothetical protein n=1 Tax=Microbacterium sp. 22296 TaxID=3453903 RepID=UPI003F8626DB
MTIDSIPGRDQIVEILKAEGAPPHIVLDIGGSADLNGDGLVRAFLDEHGELQIEDV